VGCHFFVSHASCCVIEKVVCSYFSAGCDGNRYYWWRDQGQAEQASLMASVSPCYLNRMEPVELVLGWGKAAEQALRLMLLKKGYNETVVTNLVADCFAPPLKEIQFPRDL
jgi:hypothetical protein